MGRLLSGREKCRRDYWVAIARFLSNGNQCSGAGFEPVTIGFEVLYANYYKKRIFRCTKEIDTDFFSLDR